MMKNSGTKTIFLLYYLRIIQKDSHTSAHHSKLPDKKVNINTSVNIDTVSLSAKD